MRNNTQQQGQEAFYQIRWENGLSSLRVVGGRQAKVNRQQQQGQSHGNYVQSQKQQYPLMIYQYPHEQKHPHPSQTHPSQQIHLRIRSPQIRRTRKYQITTNNAHKKYINCLRNLFYQPLSQKQILQFQQRFIKLKSNRVFFFIILVFIKYRFSQSLAMTVKEGFHAQMKQKIREYEQQIMKCNDYMLKNYRYEEIHEIEIALRAIDEFYEGNIPLAVEYLYRKDKHIIVKQNHFRASLKIVQDLEREFSSCIQEMRITQPYIKDYYQRRVSKADEIKKHVQDNNLASNQHNACVLNPNQQNPFLLLHNTNSPIHQSPIQQKASHNNNNNNNNTPQQSAQSLGNDEQEMSQNQQMYLSQSEERDVGDGDGDGDGQEEQSESHSSKSKSIRNSYSQAAYPVSIPRMVQQHRHNMQNIVFPPIPPLFYLPNFDQKYGQLFRRLVYVKSWKQLNHRFQNQQYNPNTRLPSKSNHSPPSPLNFAQGNALSRRKQ